MQSYASRLSGCLRSARRSSASRTCGTRVPATRVAIRSWRANRSPVPPSKRLAHMTAPSDVSASSTDTRILVPKRRTLPERAYVAPTARPYHAHVDGAAIAKRGAAGDHEQLPDRRESADNVLDHPFAEVALAQILVLHVEREDGDRGTSTWGSDRAHRCGLAFHRAVGVSDIV